MSLSSACPKSRIEPQGWTRLYSEIAYTTSGWEKARMHRQLHEVGTCRLLLRILFS